jgi:hypothetical protein
MFIFSLLAAAEKHEAHPFDEEHAAKVDEILCIIHEHDGMAGVLQAITECDHILQHAFHPLPEWCWTF